MRMLLLAFLVCLSSPANAQSNDTPKEEQPFQYDYSIVCDNTATIIKSLEENWKEALTWNGKHTDDRSVYSLWVNEQTGSWTLLKMTPEVSCILGTGSDSKITLGFPV